MSIFNKISKSPKSENLRRPKRGGRRGNIEKSKRKKIANFPTSMEMNNLRRKVGVDFYDRDKNWLFQLVDIFIDNLYRKSALRTKEIEAYSLFSSRDFLISPSSFLFTLIDNFIYESIFINSLSLLISSDLQTPSYWNRSSKIVWSKSPNSRIPIQVSTAVLK